MHHIRGSTIQESFQCFYRSICRQKFSLAMQSGKAVQKSEVQEEMAYIFFLTSIWPSLLSYSFRILAFSDSRSCSFSMLKSCTATPSMSLPFSW